MNTGQNKKINIKKEEDLISARQFIREIASEEGFDILATTRLITSASELTRNIRDYTKGGTLTAAIVSSGQKTGIELIFKDNGPGIQDLEEAQRDGFSSKNGLGLGLGGARRLVDEFEIESDFHKGTTIKIIKWK